MIGRGYALPLTKPLSHGWSYSCAETLSSAALTTKCPRRSPKPRAEVVPRASSFRAPGLLGARFVLAFVHSSLRVGVYFGRGWHGRLCGGGHLFDARSPCRRKPQSSSRNSSMHCGTSFRALPTRVLTGYRRSRLSSAGVQSHRSASFVVFGSSQRDAAEPSRIIGIRSCTGAVTAFGVVVSTVNV